MNTNKVDAEFDNIKKLRKKIEDINWIKDRIDIFYKKYLPMSLGYTGRYKKDKLPPIKYEYELMKDKLGEFKYIIVFNQTTCLPKIIIYLKYIQELLLNHSNWRTFQDIMNILKNTVLHEYRHFAQVKKINELDMVDLLDYDWVSDLLEMDAEEYAKSFINSGKKIDLDLVITKILLEDKVTLNYNSIVYLQEQGKYPITKEE